jgi:hypothetical protein
VFCNVKVGNPTNGCYRGRIVTPQSRGSYRPAPVSFCEWFREKKTKNRPFSRPTIPIGICVGTPTYFRRGRRFCLTRPFRSGIFMEKVRNEMEQTQPTGPPGPTKFSEKLCPLRHAANSQSTVFMPCLLNICAWCRQKDIVINGVTQGVFYCGAANDKF